MVDRKMIILDCPQHNCPIGAMVRDKVDDDNRPTCHIHGKKLLVRSSFWYQERI